MTLSFEAMLNLFVSQSLLTTLPKNHTFKDSPSEDVLFYSYSDSNSSDSSSDNQSSDNVPFDNLLRSWWTKASIRLIMTSSRRLLLSEADRVIELRSAGECDYLMPLRCVEISIQAWRSLRLWLVRKYRLFSGITVIAIAAGLDRLFDTTISRAYACVIVVPALGGKSVFGIRPRGSSSGCPHTCLLQDGPGRTHDFRRLVGSWRCRSRFT